MDRKWKKKFDEAEVTPNPRVWDKIAADLDADTPAAGATFPRYFAWAAAVALFAMSGALVWVVTSQNTPEKLAQTDTPAIESTAIQPTEKTAIESASTEILKADQTPTNDSNSTQNQQITPASPALIAQKLPNGLVTKKSIAPSATANPSSGSSVTNDNELILENETLAIADVIDEVQKESEEQPVVEKSKETKVEEFEYPAAEDFLIEKKKSKSDKNRMWVGVAQGVGSYASHMSGGNMATAGEFAPFSLERAMEELQTDERGISEQIALTTGIFVGVPLADKLSIVTGFTYNKSNFSSSAVNMNGELLHFTADMVKVNDEMSTASYNKVDVQGSYEMAVLPVLADVALLSGNFGWSMQAGPELGLLMRQQISSNESGTSRTTRPGDLYRPLHLRVALGSTLSYDVSDNFQVSFQPIVEQAVTSITTADASFKSYPLNYSALFGLRYKFN